MINLINIFAEQDKLNKETASKHKEYSELTRDQLTKNFVFSALAELGELANEWGHFKIWKSTRKENRDAPCKKCNGSGVSELNSDEDCPYCEKGRTNPLREEYIDVVHFVVSVAIGFDLEPEEFMKKIKLPEVSSKDSYNLYLDLYKNLIYANVLIEENENLPKTSKFIESNKKERSKVATELLKTLIILGYSMSFTDSDIEKAYAAKHKVNQVRQAYNY